MNQHVSHGGNLLHDRVFHSMRDFMRTQDRHHGIHFDVNINEVVISHFAHEALFHAANSISDFRNPSHFFDELARTAFPMDPPALPAWSQEEKYLRNLAQRRQKAAASEG